MGIIQVFHSDISNLLSMADMWKTRAPPVPLSFEGIKDGTFILRGKAANTVMLNGTTAPVNSQNGNGASTSTTSTGLRDQKTLTLQDNLELFISRCGVANQRRPMLKADRVAVQTVLRLVCKQAKKRFHLTRMMTTHWIS
jgi:hypothetical protein